MILEQAPEPEPAEEPEPAAELPAPIPCAVAAKGEAALRDQARRLLSAMRDDPELDPLEVGCSLAARAQLSHRVVLLPANRAQLLAGLEEMAQGQRRMSATRDSASAFLFTGQGAQRAGMGRELHEAFPAFAAALDEACDALDPHLDRRLRDLLFASTGTADAALLDRTEYTQPALFAVEAALYRLLESWGMRPDFLAGHSIGELSAAHAAGILSLDDAAKLVAARGRLMGELDEGGAMVAIAAPEEEVAEAVAGEPLAIAAVNGPDSVVVSGEEEAALRLGAAFKERGRKVARLAVSHAFHSPLMEPMLDELAAVAAELEFSAPRIPVLSGLDGEPLDATRAASPDYWAKQAREPVRFLDAVRFLAGRGVRRFLELGPDAVLSAMVFEALDDDSVLAPALMRGDRPEAETLLSSLAQVHEDGLEVRWGSFFQGTGARPVPLPTYPFQRRRYWLESSAAAGDPASVGLDSCEHPLLGAELALAGEEDRRLFSARLGLDSAPWLADHVVAGNVLLSGVACAELAFAAGRELGCELLEEMVSEAPVIVPRDGALQLQLAVAGAGKGGSRSFSLHSRPQAEEGEWTRHATGVLAPAPEEPYPEPAPWPPPGAEAVALEDLYQRLAEQGFEYGAAFQGLRAAWRDGSEFFAEVELDPAQDEEAGNYAIHPALLECALQAALLAEEDAEPRLPVIWSGLRICADSPRSLRVRLSRRGEGTLSLSATEPGGGQALAIAELATRPLDLTGLPAAARARPNSLFVLRWAEVELSAAAGETQVDILRVRPQAGADPVAAATNVADYVLGELQERLAAEAGEGAAAASRRLAVVTEGALATREGEVPDLAAAPLWGLLRAAQAEHPGRFVLIDSDGSQASDQVLERALALEEEPQLALREGRALIGRLQAVSEHGEGTAPDPDATVLITGATGTIGSRVALHLAREHGARRLLLVSDSDEAPPPQLQAELEELGCDVEFAACDVAEREQLAALLARHPLGTIVHAAEAVDDRLLTDLTAERLRGPFADKALAAWNLHELAPDCELVLFSSLAATLGSPGQANRAAADAFCEALSARRAAEGRRGATIAWGSWESERSLAGRIGEVDRARMRRALFRPVGDAEGLALFDAARTLGEPQVLAAPLQVGVLRRTQEGSPAALRDLAPPGAGPAGKANSLAVRLATAPERERDALMLAAVRTEAAAVLGYASGQAIDPGRPFKELGFDSLAAVELRNRLGISSGLRLPSTVVFDHPSAGALAAHLRRELEGATGSGQTSDFEAELDSLESRLADLGEGERMAALKRLRSILQRLSLHRDDDDEEFHRDLDSASDAEVIQLIEEEFGSV